MRENTTYVDAHLVWVMWGFVTRCIDGCKGLTWQGEYGAFSISHWDVYIICEYILNQEEHQSGNRLLPDLEAS